MKTTLLVACLSAALVSSLAVANETEKTRPTSAQTISATASNSDAITVNSNAIAVLTAINEHEVKAAEMALGKSPSAGVAQYAQMLLDEHTGNQKKTLALADEADLAANDAPAVVALIEKKEAKRNELTALPAADFETAFIDAMVQDHTEVLAKIDNELLPNTTDAEVTAHLHATRTHIAKHLEHARKLAGSLQASR